MNNRFKIILAFLGVYMAYTLLLYNLTIIASFDDDKHVDRSVFFPIDREYGFREFTQNSSKHKTKLQSFVSTDMCRWLMILEKGR